MQIFIKTLTGRKQNYTFMPEDKVSLVARVQAQDLASFPLANPCHFMCPTGLSQVIIVKQQLQEKEGITVPPPQKQKNV
jgi:hypothetical protein